MLRHGLPVSRIQASARREAPISGRHNGHRKPARLRGRSRQTGHKKTRPGPGGGAPGLEEEGATAAWCAQEMSLPERENAARVWRPCRMGDYCLTKQTATHGMRLRRACSAVKPLLQNSRSFFFTNPVAGAPRVGWLLFMKFFMKNPSFFCRKILLRHSGPKMLVLLVIFAPSVRAAPSDSARGTLLQAFFFVAAATASHGRIGTGTQACTGIVIFFTIYRPPGR